MKNGSLTALSLITWMMLTSACGRSEIPSGQHPDFFFAVQAVHTELSQRGFTEAITLPIAYGDAKGFAARCVRSAGGNYIIVDEHAWKTSAPVYQEYMIAHEVGHCVLGREHRTDVVVAPNNISRPASIMFPVAAASADWASRFNKEYFDELVGGE